MKNLRPHTLKTIKEEFNEYLLEDGNTLRAKQVMVSFSLADVPEMDKPGKKAVRSLSNFQLVTGIIPTGKVDTKELITNIEGPITKDDYVKEVKFKEQKTHFNLYETDEFLILIQILLKKVQMTKYKDKIGNPRYHIECEAIIDILDKKNFPISKRDPAINLQKNE